MNNEKWKIRWNGVSYITIGDNKTIPTLFIINF